MNETIKTPVPVGQDVPRWMKTVAGVTVFLGILATIIYGTGFFQGNDATDPAATEKTEPLAADQQIAVSHAKRDWVSGEAACLELIAEDPFDARAIFNLGYFLHRQDRLDEAAEQYQQAQDFAEYRLYSLYNLACIDAAQEQPDSAIDHLRTAISDGFVSRHGIFAEPSLASLRDDPEFQRLVLVESFNRDKQKFQSNR